MVYEIRGNLFLQDYSTEGYESETFDKISIMYHSCSNPEYAEAKSIIIIEGNICNGKINFWKMGNFMEPSTEIVYNNVATNIECIYHPRCAGNDNIVMYDFNNNIMEEE